MSELLYVTSAVRDVQLYYSVGPAEERRVRIDRSSGRLLDPAIDAGVPLLTDLQLARAVIAALRHTPLEALSPRSWSDFFPS